MSVSLQFTITNVGIASAFNAESTGFDLELTHIQLGSGNRVPDRTEIALVAPEQKATIGAGFSVSANQKRMSAIFSGATSFTIREVGIWEGDGLC